MIETLPPSERGLLGALATHARYSTQETTRAAHEGFMRRFEREVDPDGVLDEAERQRRATSARRLYMRRLAIKSAQVRAAAKAAG